jgi:RimJ/RimL family protein N-acetyltransferase
MKKENAYVHFIEGKRVYLREVRISDVGERYYTWLNDREISQFLETRFFPQSEISIREYVESMLGSRESVFLAVIRKGADEHIGNIKLGPINWIHRSAEVALVLGDKSRWRQGYGSEAIGLIVDYAFNKLNLHSLSAGIYANNVGSVNAFLKAGFKEQGVKVKCRFSDGQYVDEKIMGIINEPTAR